MIAFFEQRSETVLFFSIFVFTSRALNIFFSFFSLSLSIKYFWMIKNLAIRSCPMRNCLTAGYHITSLILIGIKRSVRFISDTFYRGLLSYEVTTWFYMDYNQGSPVTKKTFPSQMTVTVIAWPWLTFWSLSWSFWPLAFGSSSTTFSIVFFSTNLPVGNFSISSFIDAKKYG